MTFSSFNRREPNFEKMVASCLLAAIALIYIVFFFTSCKVHKVITKDLHKSDSSAFVKSEQFTKANIDSAGISTKENDYDKVTITLPEGGELPDYFHHAANGDAPKVSFPKGTTIVLEKGVTKEKDSATKKANEESFQKENSKVEVVKKDMNFNKTVDKTVPAKWEIILFCIALLGGGVAYHFRSPLYAKAKTIFSKINFFK